mgnify:CR=1 FL=1
MRITIGTLLVLLLFAPAGSAQLTEKQADAAVRSVARQARNGHASSVQQRTGAALAAIDTFRAAAIRTWPRWRRR